MDHTQSDTARASWLDQMTPGKYLPTSTFLRFCDSLWFKGFDFYGHGTLTQDQRWNPRHQAGHGHFCLPARQPGWKSFKQRQTTSVDKGSNIDTIYLDYYKAFDMVSHNILLSERGPASKNPVEYNPGEKRDTIYLIDLQGSPSPSLVTLCPDMHEVKQWWQETCRGEQGAPVKTQT